MDADGRRERALHGNHNGPCGWLTSERALAQRYQQQGQDLSCGFGLRCCCEDSGSRGKRCFGVVRAPFICPSKWRCRGVRRWGRVCVSLELHVSKYGMYVCRGGSSVANDLESSGPLVSTRMLHSLHPGGAVYSRRWEEAHAGEEREKLRIRIGNAAQQSTTKTQGNTTLAGHSLCNHSFYPSC
jgi:hypothetical protein